ncbi:hypothetical protein [Deinococcus fonticola]|uniref:hypothetical protein n=1 Tax=Deinococcus fonticola TaxID=2528713 RepID=UPI00107517ED|nr:hypothetical protein [Deinococcus fonticola]
MDEVIQRLLALGVKIVTPRQADDISRFSSKLRPGASGLAAFLAENPRGFVQLQDPDLTPLDQWFTEATVHFVCIHSDESEAYRLADLAAEAMTGDPLDPTFRPAGREVMLDTLGTGIRLSYLTLYPLEVPTWQ